MSARILPSSVGSTFPNRFARPHHARPTFREITASTRVAAATRAWDRARLASKLRHVARNQGRRASARKLAQIKHDAVTHAAELAPEKVRFGIDADYHVGMRTASFKGRGRLHLPERQPQPASNGAGRRGGSTTTCGCPGPKAIVMLDASAMNLDPHGRDAQSNARVEAILNEVGVTHDVNRAELVVPAIPPTESGLRSIRAWRHRGVKLVDASARLGTHKARRSAAVRAYISTRLLAWRSQRRLERGTLVMLAVDDDAYQGLIESLIEGGLCVWLVSNPLRPQKLLVRVDPT